MLGSITMESEASHMLEAALEQMDDIIAGKGWRRGGATSQVCGVRCLTMHQSGSIGRFLRVTIQLTQSC